MGTIDYNGLGNSYTYEAWSLITDPTSTQYQLRLESGEHYDSEDFGVINGCYVIACTTHYGNVGDYVDWTLASGQVLHTIIGDYKSSSDPNYNEYGHIIGNTLNVIEFCVNYNGWYPSHVNPGTNGFHEEWAGQIQSFQNIGNYWTGINASTSQTIFIVKAQRFELNTDWHVQYIATYQGDGYLYFNDDKFWRCYSDGTHQQVFYLENLTWIDTDMLKDIRIFYFNVSPSGSNSTVASNIAVESAVQWAIEKASNNFITYSQDFRNLKNLNGYSYDCSSFIITAFYAAGIDVNATWTGNMRSGFEAAGFTWIPGNYFDASDCLRGDILVKEIEPYAHTQMYIGNNQDVNCGSTPARICEHSPNNWGRSYGWDGILRYVS